MAKCGFSVGQNQFLDNVQCLIKHLKKETPFIDGRPVPVELLHPPPMIVFSYEIIPTDIAESVPSDWAVGKSDSGWMTGELFSHTLTIEDVEHSDNIEAIGITGNIPLENLDVNLSGDLEFEEHLDLVEDTSLANVFILAEGSDIHLWKIS
ncbi:hypothetical protein J6590_089862 [Homalodisca vitripennis]|nr:hypothetical protein J6590_089862 [Homalodisca vitripennis]